MEEAMEAGREAKERIDGVGRVRYEDEEDRRWSWEVVE